MTTSIHPGIVGRRRGVLTTTLVALFIGITCAGTALTASRAAAVFADIAETGRPGHLVLGVHASTPLWAELEPGGSMQWLVRASLHDAESGRLSVELAVADAAPAAGRLSAAISACSGEFEISTGTPSCSEVEQPVMARTPLTDFMPGTNRFTLATLKRGEPRQLLVTIAMSSAPAPRQPGTIARVGLGVHVAGEDPEIPTDPQPRRPDNLPETGAADLLPLGVLGFGLVGLGAAIVLRRRTAR